MKRPQILIEPIKIIRVTTVPASLDVFCNGLLKELHESEGYDVVAVSSPGDALEKVRLRESVPTYAVQMERHISPLKDVKSLLKLIRVFRKERPAMVHSMTPKAGLLSMLAAWLCRVPVRVHTFTGLVFPTSHGLKKRILMATDWLTCVCATHIVPEGEGVRADLLNNGITRKPIKVLGHGNVRGIDLERFDPQNEKVIEASKSLRRDNLFTYVFVGRLVGDKGINELVQAFKSLNAVHPDTRLILIGREEATLDPLRPETLAEIKSNPAIEAVGEQSDVRPWLLASDVFVFPSYREGFPNVVIEAGAMGLPCIVTNINGSREIITDGLNGLIIPPHEHEPIRKAMEVYVTDRTLVRKHKLASRKIIAERYEQSYVRGCLKEYYKEILK